MIKIQGGGQTKEANAVPPPPERNPEKMQLLYGYPFIHRQIYPYLVHVCRPCNFLKHYLLFNLFIYDIILTIFLSSLSTWLYNYYYYYYEKITLCTYMSITIVQIVDGTLRNLRIKWQELT